MAFDRQPFASTHPAINALFAAEFAQSQAQRQAEAQAMANETARAQIGAQTQLAQSQMRQAQAQQDYNNLFREREFQSRAASEQARNKLYEDQLKVDKAYKEAIVGAGPRTAQDIERNKQAIIAANANAVHDAARANAMFEIELNKQLAEDAKKRGPWYGGIGKPLDVNSTEYRAIANNVFKAVRANLLAEKSGALSNLIPDPNTFKFTPVQYDAEGNAIPGAYKAPEDVQRANVFDEFGNSKVTATPAPAGGLTQNEKVGVISTIGSAMVGKGITALGDMFRMGGTPTTPTTATTNAAPAAVVVPSAPEPTTTSANVPSVKTFYGSRIFLLTPEDDAILRNAMDGAPSEGAKTNVFQKIMRYLIESGRAVDTNERVGGIRVDIPDPAGASIPGLSHPSYLDSALGPRFGEPERYGPIFNP